LFRCKNQPLLLQFLEQQLKVKLDIPNLNRSPKQQLRLYPQVE
jgi:hypothetical protein